MPKETFFNLSAEKRKRIVEAGLKEFNQHKLKDAKIANIVKQAIIPRGSFYQYFENLSDFYFYLVEEQTGFYKRILFQALEDRDGDFFTSMEFFALRIIEEIIQSDYQNFFINIFDASGYQKYQAEKSPRAKKLEQDLLGLVDFSNLKTEKSELYHLFKLIMNIMSAVLFEGVIENQNLGHIHDNFTSRLSWLRDGCQITRGDENN